MAECVLIIQPSNESLAKVLADHYDVHTVADAERSLSCCDRLRPDVVLLDVDTSDPARLELCRQIKLNGRERPPQVIVITSTVPAEERLKVYEAGADDCLAMPIEPEELNARIGIQFRLREVLDQSWSFTDRMESYAAELERLVDAKAAALEATQDITVLALAKLADSRDPETGEHLERMRTYTQILARRLRHQGPYTDQVNVLFLEDLYRASPLHDIGKVGIPDSILLKPGRLTPEEFDQMKVHAVLGAETLEEAACHAGGCRFLKMAVQIARHHHERFDGSGYPSGLKGLEIPLAARIVALADVYDALTSRRVYKAAIAQDSAKSLIIEQSGQHFDPAIVDVFQSCFDEFLKVPQAVQGSMCANSEVVVTEDADSDVLVTMQNDFVTVPGGRILLAGDEATLSRPLAEWVKEAGYGVERVASGLEALHRIDSDCPQFLIASWKLTDMLGIELCHRMRSRRHPLYIYTLVVLPECHAEGLSAAADAGADDFLFPPIREGELLARLRSAERMLKLLRELSQRPRSDPLTGIPTRKLIDDQLRREWRRATRHSIPMSCVMVDIDRFGQVNEDLGAGHGDAVIRSVAGVLNDNCRPTDYLFRRGPDSFCLVMTETNEHGAAAYIERLRPLIAAEAPSGAEQAHPLTVSCGVAQRRANHDQIDHLIETAEQVQCVAKQLGGDRVIRFGALGDTEGVQHAVDRQDEGSYYALVARDIMSTPIVSLHQEDTIRQATDFLMHHRINSAPVVNTAGRLAGIVSEKDLMRMMISTDSWTRPIHEVMTTNVVAYDESHSVLGIYRFLLSSPIRRVIIVKGQRPIGVISRGTLLRSFGGWTLEHAMQWGRVPHPEATSTENSLAMEEAIASEAQQLADSAREAVSTEEPISRPSSPLGGR